MPLQVPSYHCLSYMADDWHWDSGLYNPIVLKDHRNSYLGGLERAMVLTFEWPVSTPKPLVWGEVSPFQCPKGWRWSKSPSFSQPIECKRDRFPKALSLTFLCHSRHTMPPKDGTQTLLSQLVWITACLVFAMTFQRLPKLSNILFLVCN